MPPEIFLALDEAMKSNCFDLYPELTPHDNVGFWIGFGYAVKVMKDAYAKEQTEIEKTEEFKVIMEKWNCECIMFHDGYQN